MGHIADLLIKPKLKNTAAKTARQAHAHYRWNSGHNFCFDGYFWVK
jgi:hypothetical protein